MSSNSSWSASPLDTAQKAFELLVCEPAPLAFDGRPYAGLPDLMLPLDELKKVLLHASTGTALRDAVWRELVIRARRDGPAWVIATVGMAMPGLRKMSRLLTAGWPGDSADLDAELIAGFMERLRVVDLDGSRICGKLIDAGVRSARKVRDQYSDTHLVHTDSAGPRLPMMPWDHPDWVLARAVARGVLHADEARLIGDTRLGHLSLVKACAALGVDLVAAKARRKRAELRLKAAIEAGELDFFSISAWKPRPNSGYSRRPVGFLLGSANPTHVASGTQHRPLGGKKSVRERAGFGAPGIGVAPAV